MGQTHCAAATMGASVGMIAAAKAQYHLRQSCVFLNMYFVNQPEVMVPCAQDKIGENGRPVDEPTRKRIGELLISSMVWTKRLSAKIF